MHATHAYDFKWQRGAFWIVLLQDVKSNGFERYPCLSPSSRLQDKLKIVGHFFWTLVKGRGLGRGYNTVVKTNGWVTGEQCIIPILKNKCYYECCSFKLTLKTKHHSLTFPRIVFHFHLKIENWHDTSFSKNRKELI